MIGKEYLEQLLVVCLRAQRPRTAIFVSILFLCLFVTQMDVFSGSRPAAPPPPASSTAITLVQQAEISVGSGAGAISQGFSSASIGGDLVVVTVKWGGQNLTVSSITDNKSNLYQSAAGPTNWSGTAKCGQTYFSKNIAGGGSPLVITVKLSGASTSSVHLYQFEYAGADPVTPVDAAGTGTGSGTSLKSGMLNTNYSNDLIHAVAFTDTGTTQAGAGFQTLTTFGGNLAENMNVSVAGAYSATAADTTSANWLLHALAIKAASAAVTTDTTPPVVNITAPANNATVAGAVQVTASASDNVAVARVQFQVDGQNAGAAVTVSPYSYAWDTTKVSNGSHKLTAVATDTSNNSATSAVVTVTVNNAVPDTTPPVVSITAPANNATVSGKITVSATATDPDSPVSFVQFQVDGANTGGQVTNAPYSILLDTTVLSNGTHALKAVAQDPSGNVGTSTAVTITISNSSAPPATITLVQQAEVSVGSGTSSISQSFSSAGAAGDLIVATVKWGGQNLSIASVIDNKGNAYQIAAGPTNWSGTAKRAQTFYAKNIAGGGAPITITVRLSGASTGSVHLYQFEYSGVDPAAPVDAAGAANGSGTSISVAGLTTRFSNDLIHAVAFTDSGSTSPGAGFQTLTTYADNLAENKTAAAAGAYSATASDSGGTNWFMHAVAFKAASAAVTTDTTPPVVTVTAPANNATVSGKITVSATATDPDSPVSFVQFQLDGANTGGQLTSAPYSILLDTTALSSGAHTLKAVAQDPSGNVGTSAAIAITVNNGVPDTTPPVVTITAPANNSTVSGTITLTATATDPDSPVSFVQFQVDGANTGAQLTTAPYSLSLDTTTLSNATHTLTAVGQDPSGNAGASAAVAITVSNATNTSMGPLKQSTSNPNYFVNPGGKAVVLSGSHTWNSFLDGADSATPGPLDFTAYVNFLKLHGQNVTILWRKDLPTACFWGADGGGTQWNWSPMPWQRTGGSSGTQMASDGLPVFDLTQFNQAFFDRLRARAQQLQQNGIYAIVELFDGFSLVQYRCSIDGYPFSAGNNANGISDGGGTGSMTMTAPNAITNFQDAYVQKVIDTLNDLPNVLWEPSEEAPDNSTWWHGHTIALIRSYEAGKPFQHPIGYASLDVSGASDSTLYNSDANWVAPQTRISSTSSCGTGTPQCKVNINDSDHSYGGMWNDTAQSNRNFLWENFTNGNSVMFMDPYVIYWPSSNRNLCSSPVHGVCSGPDSRWNNLRDNMGYIVSYANSKLDLLKMTPQGGLCSTGYCLAQTPSVGAEYLVYAPNGGSFTVNLSATTRTLNVQWLNPSNGAISMGGTIAGGSANQSFTPPFSGDAVLYLVDAAGHN